MALEARSWKNDRRPEQTAALFYNSAATEALGHAAHWSSSVLFVKFGVMTYDVIVIGVGGMGSATVYHMAKSGCKVLGLEQFPLGHSRGSSHGSTRIIRMAYSEGPEYVPLLRAAYTNWRELEQAAGDAILEVTGGLDIGPAGSARVVDARRSCLEHDIPFTELDATEINRRFPGYRLPTGMRAIHQPDGGYVRSEVAIQAHVQVARSHGAEVLDRASVTSWEARQNGFLVHTEEGPSYHARKLVFAAGAWTGRLIPELRILCRPERQVMLWTEPVRPARFTPDRFPIFILYAPSGHYYGFPDDQGEGFKLGRYGHRQQDVDDPGNLDRECSPGDEAVLRKGIETYFPDANGQTRRMAACMFTNTPDKHFILDRHPTVADVYIAAGFSGHGYKFCSVVGQIMADFCLDRELDWDLGSFSLARFQDSSVFS